MRISVAILALFAFACTAAPALADPTAEMVQMQKAFASLKSYHAEMRMSQGRSVTIDFVAPDKFRETMYNGIQSVVIGSDMWMKVNGKWSKLPGSMPFVRAAMDSMRSAGVSGELRKTYTVTDLGPAMIGPIPVHHYRMVKKSDNTAADMWLAMNHLPLQVKVNTPQGPMTILYSQYNQVADITRPM
jgi:outer membrane lipoprotein-sorting protein